MLGGLGKSGLKNSMADDIPKATWKYLELERDFLMHVGFLQGMDLGLMRLKENNTGI